MGGLRETEDPDKRRRCNVLREKLQAESEKLKVLAQQLPTPRFADLVGVQIPVSHRVDPDVTRQLAPWHCGAGRAEAAQRA